MICPSCGKDNPSGSVYCNICGSKFPSRSTTVYCPFCGASGQEYQISCTKCGKELPRDQMAGMFEPSTSSLAERPCPNCGRSISIYEINCPYCGTSDANVDLSGYEAEGAYHSGSDLPVIGGVLILIGGILGLVHGGLTLSAIGTINSLGYSLPASVTCCGLLMCLFGLIALFGGYSSIKKDSFAFALIGGILGILSIGLYLGAFLSLIGVVIVAVAHRDFER